MSKSKDKMSEVANKIAALMAEHGTGWVKPWEGKAAGRPVNATTGKNYNGINILILMSAGFASPYWASYNQWQAVGAQVKKDQKGTFIMTPMPITSERKNKEGETETYTFMQYSTKALFNADQVEGWQAPAQDVIAAPVDANGFEHCAAMEEFFDQAGVQISHGGDRAFYSPKHDRVQMPNKTDFIGTDTSTAAEAYYSTLAHEATHWTGHASRLDRLKSKRFGDKNYAFEELVAEIGAVFMSVQFGVSPAPRPDHAQYLNNWIAALKAEPRVIFTAASQAQKAVDFIAEAAAHDRAIAA